MEISDRTLWFRRLALAGALLAAAVVVLGAWVRLTDAGLGCPDWPGCYGHIYPENEGSFVKGLHEMIHRYFAGTLVTIIALLMVFAIWNRRAGIQRLTPVVMLFFIVLMQAALGALTVTMLVKPLIVTAHLLGGLTTLGILWWLSLEPPAGPLALEESKLRPWALVAFAALAVQIFLGGWTSTNYAAVACPDLPTCQGSYWPAMDFHSAFVLWRKLDVDYTGGILSNAARTAIHVTHRIGAVVTGSILMMVGAAVARRANSRRIKVAGSLIIAAVLLQISIGLSMVHLGMPLTLAVFHNAGAALLVVCLVTLLRTLWPVGR
jgi:cytochrome c oxidase assembly protein subunit 15